MRATREYFKEVVDAATTLLQTTTVNGHDWAAIKAMKPVARKPTIAAAVSDAEAKARLSVAPWRRPTIGFSRDDHKQASISVERWLKYQADVEAVNAEHRKTTR